MLVRNKVGLKPLQAHLRLISQTLQPQTHIPRSLLGAAPRGPAHRLGLRGGEVFDAVLRGAPGAAERDSLVLRLHRGHATGEQPLSCRKRHRPRR